MQGVVMVALIILALGLGLVGPNMTVFLGNTYNEKDTEIFGLPGFILFSMVINLVVFIAPPLSNYLKHVLGYSSIFFVAFASALTSLILFLQFKTRYNQLDLYIENNTKQPDVTYRNVNTTLLVSTLFIYALISFAIHQKGLTFKFSLRDFVNQGFALEQTLTDAGKYISILLAILFVIVTNRMKSLTWKSILNIIITGTVICTIAWVMIAAFKPLSELMGEQTLFINAFALILIAETLIHPAISYTVYRTSPERYKGLFQGLLYAVAATSLSFLAIGVNLYESSNPTIAFIVFSVILVISAMLTVILKGVVNHKLSAIKQINK
jgi:dipeptide/tripeptide permease